MFLRLAYILHIYMYSRPKKGQLTDGLDSVLHHICDISAKLTAVK